MQQLRQPGLRAGRVARARGLIWLARPPPRLRPPLQCLAEYIWIAGGSAQLESRTIVLDAAPDSIEALPVAEIDGSFSGVVPSEACELFLRPRKMFADPLRGGVHILVLCDVYVPPQVRRPGVPHGGAAAGRLPRARSLPHSDPLTCPPTPRPPPPAV
jgi:hypothetical protein